MISKTLVRTGLAAGLMSALCVVQSARADGEAVPEAELLAAMCDTCHGIGGAGARPNPSIQGIDTADFVDLLKAFASGEEKSTIMRRHAEGYTDAQIQALADHYAKQGK